jgi:hypothetical protein
MNNEAVELNLVRWRGFGFGFGESFVALLVTRGSNSDSFNKEGRFLYSCDSASLELKLWENVGSVWRDLILLNGAGGFENRRGDSIKVGISG